MINRAQSVTDRPWWARWTKTYPPRLKRRCDCFNEKRRMLDVIFIEHFLPNGSREYFLHQVCQHNTPKLIEAKLNEIGAAPPDLLERYQGVYRVLGEKVYVESVDPSWQKYLWVGPVEAAMLEDEWQMVKNNFFCKFTGLLGWERLWRMAEEALETNIFKNEKRKHRRY